MTPPVPRPPAAEQEPPPPVAFASPPPPYAIPPRIPELGFASPPPPYAIPPRIPELSFAAAVAIPPPAAAPVLAPRRRLARDLGLMLILGALLLAADGLATLLWQEPVTAVIALWQHDRISDRAAGAPLSQLDRHALAGLTTTQQRLAFLARREQRRLTAGAGVGRIAIPKIGVSFEVVEGTDAGSLERGPGHYRATPLPGERGTVAIAGHRTTYLAPFRNLNELAPGDRIVVRMPYATFDYVVQQRRIVSPTADWVLRDVGYSRLVLTACNPLFSAAQRIVVFARLSRVHPGAEAGL